MGTMKLHFLEQLREDLHAMGVIENLHAGLYKAMSKQLKEYHEIT